MSKLSLAAKLADETGIAVSNARKLIDDVGVQAAEDATRAAEDGSRLPSGWWTKGMVGGSALGGGALIWRQQDIDRVRSDAERAQSTAEALAAVAENDSLTPEQRRQLIASITDGAGKGGDGDGGDGPFGDLFADAQTTIILVIVMVFVLKFALDGGDD